MSRISRYLAALLLPGILLTPVAAFAQEATPTETPAVETTVTESQLPSSTQSGTTAEKPSSKVAEPTDEFDDFLDEFKPTIADTTTAEMVYLYVKPGTTVKFTAIVRENNTEKRIEPKSSVFSFGEGVQLPGWTYPIDGRTVTLTVPASASEGEKRATITYTYDDGSQDVADVAIQVVDGPSRYEGGFGMENGEVVMVGQSNTGGSNHTPVRDDKPAGNSGAQTGTQTGTQVSSAQPQQLAATGASVLGLAAVAGVSGLAGAGLLRSRRSED